MPNKEFQSLMAYLTGFVRVVQDVMRGRQKTHGDVDTLSQDDIEQLVREEEQARSRNKTYGSDFAQMLRDGKQAEPLHG
jgi:hypothetical protein